MPLELGVFLGAKRFGAKGQKSKRCIIFDKQRYRYQSYISDIAGQDIHAHRGRIVALIEEVASWLRGESRDPKVPGGRKMASEFAIFQKEIPTICLARRLEPDELTFGDYVDMVGQYVAGYA